MTFSFFGCDKKGWSSGWRLALCLTAFLAFSGCKQWETRNDEFRHNDLTESAKQVRSRESRAQDKEKKAASDPWMSDKANEISRNLE
jgi:hypothetical protein